MIGIIGNDFFGPRIVDALNKKTNARFIYPSLHDLRFKEKINNIDIIHFIGSPTVSTHGVLTLLRFRSWNKKIIAHWIGGDAWLVSNKKRFKWYTSLCKNKIDIHLADDYRLIQMISKIGIKAIEQPLPVATHYNIEPLPKEKHILVYGPDETEYFWKRFNGDIIKKIVKEFPNVNFTIVRNSGKYFSEPNVKCFKWVTNMEELYKKSIAVIRIPTHDGLPGTMVETLSMGRQFIYSDPFPFCKTAKTFEDLKKLIQENLDNSTLNIEGANYVNDKYDIGKITDSLIEIYNKL